MIRIAAYLVAHFGKSLLWTGSDLLTVYVLVRMRGMAPAMAGGLFLVGLLLNALADGGFGRVLTVRPHWRMAMALGGLVIAAIAFPATMHFSGVQGWDALALPLAGTILFRIAYAAYDVPHNALMGELARATPHGALLARGRTLGTALAALALGVGLDLEPAARHLSQMLGAVAAGAVLLGALALPLLMAPPPDAAPNLRKAQASTGLPWRFLAGTLLLVVGTGALSKALLHLPVDRAAVATGNIVILLTLGRLACTFYPLPLRDGQQGLARLAAVHAVTGVGVLAFLWGNSAAMILTLGMAMGTANLMAWMLLPRLARHSGDYGVYTMASKLALGLSGWAMSAMLQNGERFDSARLTMLIWGVAVACILAGALLFPRLPRFPHLPSRVR